MNGRRFDHSKQQAKRIVCPTRPTEKPYRLSEPAKCPHKPGLLGRLIPLGFVVALGAYGYSEYTDRVNPQTVTESQTSDTVTAVESNDSLTTAAQFRDPQPPCPFIATVEPIARK